MKSIIFFALCLISNLTTLFIAAFDILERITEFFFKKTIASLINVLSFTSNLIEFSELRISSLNAKSEDITGNPQAIASIIALLQPSPIVGKTNMSAALRYLYIRLCSSGPWNNIFGQFGFIGP